MMSTIEHCDVKALLVIFSETKKYQNLPPLQAHVGSAAYTQIIKRYNLAVQYKYSICNTQNACIYIVHEIM